MMKLNIFCDGASAGNPGPASVGILFLDAGGAVVHEVAKMLTEGERKLTNNEAEYSAVLEALREARRMRGEDLTIHSDSQLVVNQIQGRWECNHDNLREIRDRIRRCMAAFPAATVTWIPRAQNERADALASDALGRVCPPEEFNFHNFQGNLRRIAHLQSEISQLQSKIGHMESEIEPLQAELERLRTENATLRAQPRLAFIGQGTPQ